MFALNSLYAFNYYIYSYDMRTYARMNWGGVPQDDPIENVLAPPVLLEVLLKLGVGCTITRLDTQCADMLAMAAKLQCPIMGDQSVSLSTGASPFLSLSSLARESQGSSWSRLERRSLAAVLLGLPSPAVPMFPVLLGASPAVDMAVLEPLHAHVLQLEGVSQSAAAVDFEVLLLSLFLSLSLLSVLRPSSLTRGL